MRRALTFLAGALAVAWATAAPAAPAHTAAGTPAAMPPGAGRSAASPTPAASPQTVWQQECGACHVPYPPRLLPAQSWQRLMAGLSTHFGVDASLDTAARTAVERWLVARAGRDGPGPADNRITHSAGFLDEHGELPAATFRRPAIKSAANCGACHRDADQGVFDEHDFHVPR